MRVLLLPANNAPEFHVKALEEIINRHEGHKVVRWHQGMSDNDYDFAIIIAGRHNKENIRLLWNNYTPGESLDMDDLELENDYEIHIGKGLYSFINGTVKNLYLLMAPSEGADQDVLDDFENDHRTKGPAFLHFDDTDTVVRNLHDYTLEYGYIQLDCISDTVAYKYKDIIEENGGYCKLRTGQSEHGYTASPDRSETPLSLLLLRR